MKRIAYTNGSIFTGEELLSGMVLLTEDHTISNIVNPKDIPAEYKIIDLEGGMLAPGLLDLQIYGGGGYLFSADPSAEALMAMTNALTDSGTTGFLVTLATNSLEIFKKAIQVIQENPHPAVLGLHLEGPYINPLKRGAHIEHFIKKPEFNEVKSLLDLGKGIIKMVTLAPELASKDILNLFISYNVIVSAGHSNASFEEASLGFNSGIQTATHLFNAMSALHHRNTGLPGAIMLHPHARASIIPDGIHVDYTALSIAKKIMGERLFLITDAVEACDTGPYQHVKGETHYTMPDGTLSGSAITLLQGVRNCVKYADIDPEESLRMASLYPARLMGYSDRGMLTPGARADMIIVEKNLHLRNVIISGNFI